MACIFLFKSLLVLFRSLLQLTPAMCYVVDKVLNELVSRYLSHEFNEEVSEDHEGRMIICSVSSPVVNSFPLRKSLTLLIIFAIPFFDQSGMFIFSFSTEIESHYEFNQEFLCWPSDGAIFRVAPKILKSTWFYLVWIFTVKNWILKYASKSSYNSTKKCLYSGFF